MLSWLHDVHPAVGGHCQAVSPAEPRDVGHRARELLGAPQARPRLVEELHVPPRGNSQATVGRPARHRAPGPVDQGPKVVIAG